MIIINFIRGFLMALADSVPGVSGGTIAFILGFYDRFINSLNSLVSGEKEERLESLYFLIKLGIGWITGFIISVLIITSIFEENIYKISSLFLGFILASIPLVIMQEKELFKSNYKHIPLLLIGIAVVVLITLFNPNTTTSADTAFMFSNLSVSQVLILFVAGVVAVSTMILPGISGSTVLLILGIYGPLMYAIKEILAFDMSYFFSVFVFGVGIIFGALFVIKIIKYLLQNYRSQTLYVIVGLMLGSLVAVINGPKTLDKEILSYETFSIIFFIIGVSLVLGLEKLRRFLEK